MGKLLNWTRDFLSNRKQRVRVVIVCQQRKMLQVVFPKGAFWDLYCLPFSLITFPMMQIAFAKFLLMIQKYMTNQKTITDCKKT